MKRAVLAALLLSSAAHATTYYVGPNGSDGADGKSLGTAFATVQAGVNAAGNPGDSVEILAGRVYGGGTGSTAPIVLSHSGSGAGTTPGGACSAPITIEGYRWGARPVIAGSTGASPGGAIVSSGVVSCIVLTNLEIAGQNGSLTWQGVSANAAASGTGWQAATYNSYGVDISGNVGSPSHHLVFSKLYVHDFPEGGIGCVHCDYVSVTGNIVTNNGLYSPYNGSNISLYQLQGADSTISTHNLVTGNWASGAVNLVPNDVLGLTRTTASALIAAGSTTIPVTSASGLNYTSVVLDPVGGCIPPGSVVSYFASSTSIALNQATTCQIASGSALVFGYATDGHGIIIDDNQCAQIACSSPYQARTLVQSNITAGNGDTGLQANPTTYYVDIVNNTSYLDQVGANDIGSTGAHGAIYTAGGLGTTVAGNIIVAGPQVPSLIGYDALTTWSNNLVFGGILGNFGHAVPGAANVFADPQFVAPGFDALNSNFRLQSSSPASGRASSLFSRAADYYGQAVNTPDSIGVAR